MRVPRPVIFCQGVMTAAAVGVAVLTAGEANWNLPVFLVLMILAVASEVASFNLEISRMRISGSFVALVLCMVLLGGVPAAIAGVATMLLSYHRTRESRATLRNNVVVYAVFPLAAGLAFAHTRDALELSRTDPAYYLLVFGTFAIALGLNFVLIAGYGAWTGRAPFMLSVREALIPLLASETVTAAVTVGATFLYVKTGLPGLVLVGCATYGFQHLLTELLVSQQRARELEVRTHQLHEQALTDELSGLGNRRRLMEDLEVGVERASAETPMLLVSFDLDGFKQYNDAFGHPEGDLLLRRLARRLAETMGSAASSYRPGGDEFCIIAFPEEHEVDRVVRTATEALAGHGEGFTVSCSSGAVLVPGDARNAASALRLADQRMYADKESRPASAKRQARDLLMSVLAEQQPDLHDHLSDVGALAVGIARELGMSGTEIDDVRRAAELHDVGKIAIPADILAKPGALDDEEWSYMRRHTLIGERMLAAAPALRGVARLVRSSHERWDGMGYPDGLVGEEIPLGARIIAVCDAFDAMRSRRAYKDPVPEAQTLTEIRRCAGAHFDPRVVEAFVSYRTSESLADALASGTAQSRG